MPVMPRGSTRAPDTDPGAAWAPRSSRGVTGESARATGERSAERQERRGEEPGLRGEGAAGVVRLLVGEPGLEGGAPGGVEVQAVLGAPLEDVLGRLRPLVLG